MRALVEPSARTVATVIALAILGGCGPARTPESALQDYTVRQVTLGDSGAAEKVQVAHVGPRFFPSFPEASMVLGRSFAEDEYAGEASPVAVLGSSAR